MRRRVTAAASLLCAAAVLATAACSPGRSSSTPSTTSDSAATASSDGRDAGSDTTSAPPTTARMPEVTTPVLTWTECGENLDCATLTAPLDWATPDDRTVQMPVVRFKARKPSQRIGSMLVNPGGPGFGGTVLARSATSLFSKTLLDRFDIVGWDPRGTGGSNPAVDCISDYDYFFASGDGTDSAAEHQRDIDLSKELAQACASKNGDLLAHISTQDAARDMDLLRRALGEDRISYFGFSYGSELGATWATMFPTTVRAAVLDGAADPNADALQSVVDQAHGFETALNSFFEYCRKECKYPSGGDPAVRFDEIIANIGAHSYPTVANRPPLSWSMAWLAIGEALYSQELWPALDTALVAAEQGDGSIILSLYDSYFMRNVDGTYPDTIEAFFAISCLDQPGPSTVEGVDANNGAIDRAAPRFGQSFHGGYVCVFWPVPGITRLRITGSGAGPVIVIGTTNDPATPIETSARMAKALEGGVLLTVNGDGHTGYRQSKCARQIVDRYFVDSKVPADGTVCD